MHGAPVFLRFFLLYPQNLIKPFPIVGIRCFFTRGAHRFLPGERAPARRKRRAAKSPPAFRLRPDSGLKRVRFRFAGDLRTCAGRNAIEEATDELWRRYAADRGDIGLRNRLAERYLPLVRNYAEQTAEEIRGHLAAPLRGRITVDDLMSAGMLGLLGAVAEFDPAGGVPFGDFAGPRILEAIDDEIRSLDWLPLSFFAKGIRRGGGPPEVRP